MFLRRAGKHRQATVSRIRTSVPSLADIGEECAGALILRIVDQLFRGSLLHDDAVRHENDAVGNIAGKIDFINSQIYDKNCKTLVNIASRFKLRALFF